MREPTTTASSALATTTVVPVRRACRVLELVASAAGIQAASRRQRVGVARRTESVAAGPGGERHPDESRLRIRLRLVNVRREHWQPHARLMPTRDARPA